MKINSITSDIVQSINKEVVKSLYDNGKPCPPCPVGDKNDAMDIEDNVKAILKSHHVHLVLYFSVTILYEVICKDETGKAFHVFYLGRGFDNEKQQEKKLLDLLNENGIKYETR